MSESKFLEQVRENQGIIYKLVGLYAGDDEEKKDMYQEVLLQAWKSWPNFRGEAKFSTWLYRICLNTLLVQRRKGSLLNYQESLDDISPAVQHRSVQEENSAHLQKAIRQLAETDRAIVSLHLDGYNNQEIAGLIGVSGNHVAVKLHRSKQQLANLLKRTL